MTKPKKGATPKKVPAPKQAKKPKRGIAPLPSKEKAVKMRPSDVEQIISAKKLKELLRADSAYKSQIDLVVGSLREKIAYAVSKDHLNKKAYAIVKSFYRMPGNKLAELWPVVLAYMDSAGLMERIDQVLRLDLGDDVVEEVDEDEEADEPEAPRPGPVFGGSRTSPRTSKAVAALAERAGVGPGPAE